MASFDLMGPEPEDLHVLCVSLKALSITFLQQAELRGVRSQALSSGRELAGSSGPCHQVPTTPAQPEMALSSGLPAKSAFCFSSGDDGAPDLSA